LIAVHIVGAAFWVGGNFILNVFSWRVTKSGNQEEALWFLGLGEWVGMRVFMPLSLIVLAAGAWLVTEAGWGYDELFVQLGLTGFVLTFLGGAALISPSLKKAHTAVTEYGIDSAEGKAAIGRLTLISRLDLLLLVLVALNMVLKPGL
jgi:cytochrome bd-type quinol oxidase subunit 1